MNGRFFSALFLLAGIGCSSRVGEFFMPLSSDRELIKTQEKISTPEEAKNFLEFWEYLEEEDKSAKDDFRSLKHSLNRGGGDCANYVFASIALLIDDNYLPAVLCLKADYIKKTDNIMERCEEEHGVHLLYKDKKFGVHGFGDFIPPKYNSLEELIRNWGVSNFVFSRGEYRIIVFTHLENLLDGEGNLYEEMRRNCYVSPWKPIREVLERTSDFENNTKKKNY